MKPLPDMSRCSGSQSAEQQCLGTLTSGSQGIGSRGARALAGRRGGQPCCGTVLRSATWQGMLK